jgi:hypothetical protein
VTEWGCIVAADLRERVARAIARDENGDETGWQAWRNEADAVLAELAPELSPKAEPAAWRYRINGVHVAWSDVMPPDDAYDVGTLQPLYTAPQPQASPQARAEDVGLISEVLIFTLNDGTWLRPKVREVESAWQRIRASLGVGK